MEESQRPWGDYEILKNTDLCKVKMINVNVGQRLSYQYHKRRDEFWVIVNGVAKVTINDEEFELKKGEEISVQRKTKHRVENIGDSLLSFVEVQTGEYFGEDDIVRLEDDYNRI